jgi:hypothetical protein
MSITMPVEKADLTFTPQPVLIDVDIRDGASGRRKSGRKSRVKKKRAPIEVPVRKLPEKPSIPLPPAWITRDHASLPVMAEEPARLEFEQPQTIALDVQNAQDETDIEMVLRHMDEQELALLDQQDIADIMEMIAGI